ncbi:MAG: hypothetical protein PWP63_1975 [Methanolobus sp.]|nr:hypothetical protein [Methanolobus sp.]
MEKCGACGHDVEKQPRSTSEGKCDTYCLSAGDFPFL